MAVPDGGWMIFDAGKQFGPHSREEVASFLAAGGLSPNAQVWQDGMKVWVPASRLAEEVPRSPSAEPPAIPYRAVPPAPQARGLPYRQRVGRRSFIFQICLLAWTILYAAWILTVMMSAGTHSTSSPTNPYSPYGTFPQPPSAILADTLAGTTSSWMCLIFGWGVVGLCQCLLPISPRHPPGDEERR